MWNITSRGSSAGTSRLDTSARPRRWPERRIGDSPPPNNTGLGAPSPNSLLQRLSEARQCGSTSITQQGRCGGSADLRHGGRSKGKEIMKGISVGRLMAVAALSTWVLALPALAADTHRIDQIFK